MDFYDPRQGEPPSYFEFQEQRTGAGAVERPTEAQHAEFHAYLLRVTHESGARSVRAAEQAHREVRERCDREAAEYRRAAEARREARR